MSGDMRPPRPWWRRWWVWAKCAAAGGVARPLVAAGQSGRAAAAPGHHVARHDAAGCVAHRHGPELPPFETLADDGAIVGYDVDLARAMAAQWDMEVELVAIGFDSLIDALIAGKVDSVISALPLDPRLTKDIAYSAPYFEAGLRLAVPQASALAATDPAALEPDAFDPGTLLDGRTVAVEWGSTGDMIGRG
ncbi:MAG: transporter substrate-binding domain-containing protein [Caldilineaceae bacterium]